MSLSTKLVKNISVTGIYLEILGAETQRLTVSLQFIFNDCTSEFDGHKEKN